MILKIIKFFWPDLSDQEAYKYGLLSLAFFFTVGSYWLLKTLKDGVFFNIVGGEYQPKAKMFSVVVISCLVIIYSKLVDIFKRHKLFYIIGSIYAFFFAIMAFLIGFTVSSDGIINERFMRVTGWTLYFLVESYGSLIVVLFWSFVASISDTFSAKRGYALIMVGAQLGAVIGPFLSWYASILGLRFLFLIATFGIICLMLVIKYFVRVIPREQKLVEETKKNVSVIKKTKTGFWEGLKLLATQPYLFGIFMIVSLYEIVTTIVDYQMKMQAQALPEYSSKEALTSFMGIFGMSTNGFAFFMALLGTGYLIKKFGVRKCLLIFPVCLGFAILMLYFVITSGSVSTHKLLWLTLSVMIIAKGLSYSLNNPVKEILYIPTSKDAKFKTKGWIDAFGARSSKAMGSAFTNMIKHSPKALLHYGTILSLGFIGIWFLIAVVIGRKCHQLTKDGKIIG